MKAFVASVLLALANFPLPAEGAEGGGATVAARRWGAPVPAAQMEMELTIVNQSGYDDSKVFFIVMEAEAPVGYVDFRNGNTLVRPVTWSFDPATMTASLAQIKQLNGSSNPYTLKLPPIASGRVYFSYGENFSEFPVSGPTFSKGNQLICDKFEFATIGDPNINQTNVDFFGVSYNLTATEKGTANRVTVGFSVPSDTVYKAFQAIVSSPDAQQWGNTDTFKQLIVTNSNGDVIRVIAPKAAAYTDLDFARAGPRETSHFFDDYVNNQCWRKNRKFTFRSKGYPADANLYCGKVDAAGLNLSVYSDKDCTVLYSPSPIPRLSNDWSYPVFDRLWHNTGGAADNAPTDIDWGFALGGQAGPDPAIYPQLLTTRLIKDPVLMAIPVSIVRGVMHLDDGDEWTKSTNFYKGLGGASTSQFPIYYYAKILHDLALGKKAYALSFDDVFGANSSIQIGDAKVTLTLNPLRGTTASGFNVVPPCRVADTRAADGPLGGPALAAGAIRAFDLGGVCGIPTDATAVSLNVTMADATAAGNVVLFPGTGAVPGTNTVNFVPGKARANNTMMGLVGGILSVKDDQAAGTVHFIVDVNGYYR